MSLENPAGISKPSNKKELVRLEREKAQELYGRTQEILNTIDFKTLKDILTEERARSGVGQPDKFECSLKKVGMMYIGGAHGGYFSDEKIVILDPIQILEEQYDDNLDKIAPGELDLKTEILSILIHEETHSASKASGLPSSPPADLTAFLLSHLKPVRLGVSGLSTSARFEGGKVQRGHFHLFNEAVTDHIAEEVWHEYHTRTGNKVQEGQKFRSNYSFVVALLESFIAHAAMVTNVPREVVWEGIKHEYMNGTDMGSSELKDVFEELAMGEILKGIEDVGSENVDHIIPLIERMNISDVPADARERITKGIQYIQKGLELRDALKQERESR